MDSLDRQLAAFHLKRRTVKGDGNCAFRAYAVLLGQREDNYQQMRTQIADVIEQNQVLFEELQLVPGNLRVRVDNIRKTSKQPGTNFSLVLD